MPSHVLWLVRRLQLLHLFLCQSSLRSEHCLIDAFLGVQANYRINPLVQTPGCCDDCHRQISSLGNLFDGINDGLVDFAFPAVETWNCDIMLRPQGCVYIQSVPWASQNATRIR